MKHYDITEWVDYVRGVADSGVASDMRSHLESGCEACALTAQRLGLVAAHARNDHQYEPPAHLLHYAQAAFSLQKPARLLTLPQLVVRMVFNSFDAALTAGTRGLAEEVSRQTLFEAGDFSVHLRFEQPSRSTRVSLVGQISNRRTPEPPMAHVPVFLTRGRTVVARSLSNEFGEFQVEYEPRKALQLHIPVAHGRQRIRLALNDLHGSVTGDAQSPAPPSPRRASRVADGSHGRS